MGHLIAGNVDIPAMSWLLVGSIPGVLIGSQVSVGLPETVLRMALAAALALSGLKLLDVPYANEIVVVSLSVGSGRCSFGASSSSSGAAAGSSRRSRSPPNGAHEVARPVRH